MSGNANDTENAALELLFADARKYPLLTPEAEKTIDSTKWRSLEKLQQLLVTDRHCRKYLHQWARNTLDYPPNLETFAHREHYYLLRREHVDLLAGGKRHAALVSFRKRIASSAAQTADSRAITALRLPPGLTSGIAETLLAERQPRGVAAALQYWHGFWASEPCITPSRIDPDIRAKMREQLQRYYASREQLVNHNLRLVFTIAGRHRSPGASYRDLIQSGVIGLIRAAEKFEHRKGFRFSTYAYNWVSQSVRHTTEDQRGIVRYPAGINEKIARMHRERIVLHNTTGTEPDLPTLARHLKMEPEALRRLKQVGNLPVSLDEPPHGGTEGPTLGEILEVDTFGATPDEAEQASLNRCLMQRLTILDPPEQRVIIRRWGLDQSPALTRAEIANQMAVSTEWVRQLEVSALAKLAVDEDVAEAYRNHQSI